VRVEYNIAKQVSRLFQTLLICTLLIFAIPHTLFSQQCVQLIPLEVINPGFEGPTGVGITPAPWNTCGISPDTQPGSWGVTLPPSEGNSYVGFVYGGPAWQEGASQQLSGTMQAGITYTFTIDLSATPANGGGINPNSFCSMEVWGGNAICQKTTMLWNSPVITNYGWETYTVSFTPTQNFPFLYFVCSCGPLGYILLDNITPLVASNPNVFITSHIDGDAESCSFVLEGNVNDAIIDSVVLTGNFQGSPISAPMNDLDWAATLSFNGAGNQTVTATAYYLNQQFTPTCVFTEVDLILNAPVSAFTFVSQCQDIGISFTDASTPFGTNTVTNWDWNFGDATTSTQPNPTHNYTTAGTYTVSLEITTSDGCSVISTQDVAVYQLPVAAFNFNEACEGDVTDFNDMSISTLCTIQSWQWDFDNANTANIQNPTNTYTTLGVYQVELVVTTTEGCSNTIVQDVGMHPLPVADFNFTDACLNTDFQFQNQSTVVTGSVDDWQWNFDDTNTSTNQNPTNQYAADGTFNVSLIVTTDQGCTDIENQALTVHPLPVANFTNSTECAQDFATEFTNASAVTSGSIPTWQWYFGDSEVSNLQNPTNTYSQGNTYTTSLVATTALGCQDSVAMDITVYSKPTANFASISACFNELNVFADQSSVIGSQINGWEWDFGDNTANATSQNPTYVYAASGQFSVTLISITSDGCRDTVSNPTNVFDLPVADFTFNNICEDDSAQFIDVSTVPTGTINDWQWDFGNGNAPNVQTPNPQSYAQDDFYPVSLIVGSGFGCSDTLQTVIEIYPVPVANFTFDSVCFPLLVEFEDLSNPNGTYPITNWQWSFSDAQSSTQQSPLVAFAAAGTYSATLQITNGPGCKSIFSAGDAVVHPVPVADFPAALAVCLEDAIFFSDLSTLSPVTNDIIDMWRWDFDDTNLSSTPNPYHVYNAPALYNVQLETTTNNSCTHSVIKVVEIYPLPFVDFAADPEKGCFPLNVQFYDQSTISSPYSLAEWDWYLGNDSTISVDINPFMIYSPEIEPLDIAQYDIGLIITSGNGCVTVEFRENYITVYPKPNAEFSVNEDEMTVIKPTFEFTDLSSENVTLWDWNFGDENYANVQHPVHSYLGIGIYSITLVSETQYGCLDTFGLKVEVIPVFSFYIPNSFTPDNDGINDEFFGKGEFYTDYAFYIYDRWGELIFETSDDQFHWDGSFKGTQVKQGTYVYKFNVVDWKGDEHRYDGHVTLHR